MRILKRAERFVAERVKMLKESATVALPDKARVLKEAGVDVIDLAEGDPHFDTPEKIKVAAKKALDEGFVHYISSQGLIELRSAISEKLKVDNEISADESEIIVTVGAKQAIFTAMLATLNPGDEVLVPDPYWPSYEQCISFCGARLIPVHLWGSNDFRLSQDELEEKIVSKTRMIIVNSPHNPTGTVFPEEDLKMISDIAKEHDLLVISDEIYEHLIYDGRHRSIAALPDMTDRTIVINGFSKAYSMTGWRLGYAVANKTTIRNMLKIQQHSTTHPTSFVQKSGVTALRECGEDVRQRAHELKRCRDYFIKELNNMKAFSCRIPKGAFYAFPQIKMSSAEMAEYLLKKSNVLVVPGSAFGKFGEGYLRMVYSKPMGVLMKAIHKMRTALDDFPQNFEATI